MILTYQINSLQNIFLLSVLGQKLCCLWKISQEVSGLQKVFWHNYEVFIDKQHAKRIRQFHWAYQKLRGREASPPPKTKITTKSWITSRFFHQITLFFLHLVCLSILNWCAKKVFIIYRTSWDNSKVLAEPWYPAYPLLGYLNFFKERPMERPIIFLAT